MNISKSKPIGTLVRGLLAGAALLGASESVHAASIGLTQRLPDITVGKVNATYSVGGTNNFQAVQASSPSPAGFFTYVLPSAPATQLYMLTGTYSIMATISNTGVLSGGTVSLSGQPQTGPSTWGPVTTIFSATITNFGFAGTTFEFLANITSGSTALGFAPGNQVGIILSQLPFTNFNTAFNQNGCANTNTCSQSDNFTVPEPASLALLGVGTLAAGAMRRRAEARKGAH